MKLSKDERRWISLKWREIRNAQQLADRANRRWKELNDAVNSYLDRMGINDPVQRMRHKEVNIALKDELATGNWHSRNAERHIADVQLFLKLRELGVEIEP